ncbi:D-alanine--D-alanine ligase family protein [Allonocardiopsis opalescens]|uniref:D-alanine--D-alanine ligase n=1 Tax=Allonocardiopsis opalescens TaxID=1144618 RepID=A0A2T0PVU3_9ACTN|nr:D-alanine--D-alanine ligase family protein [Allonocardiopsis opalescens]PRX95652.1 D-alanine--D-alanine ligase [Allonocardiopsis opalescens]
MAEQQRIRVAVVFGGRSSEHAISCVTAGSVLAAIDTERYEVVPVGIATDGRWVLATADPAELAIADGRLPEVDGSGPALALPLDARPGGLLVHTPGAIPSALGEVDVVLPLLHGPYGEDGTIQGLLELADVRYVGSGVFASAAAMDKAHMKTVLAGNGLECGPYTVVSDRAWRTEPKRVRDDIAALGFPVFVKPSRAGSSIGISKVDGPDELDAAIEAARAHDLKVIVEAAVSGREIECGVLEGRDGGAAEASLPAGIEISGDHAFYDFESKYLGEGSSLTIPAELPAGVTERVRQLAVRAFDALGCEGLARVDFFYTDDGRVLINEVNTMPGFTPSSAFPQMWAATGVDYPALVDRLLQTALRRPLGLR